VDFSREPESNSMTFLNKEDLERFLVKLLTDRDPLENQVNNSISYYKSKNPISWDPPNSPVRTRSSLSQLLNLAWVFGLRSTTPTLGKQFTNTNLTTLAGIHTNLGPPVTEPYHITTEESSKNPRKETSTSHKVSPPTKISKISSSSPVSLLIGDEVPTATPVYKTTRRLPDQYYCDPFTIFPVSRSNNEFCTPNNDTLKNAVANSPSSTATSACRVPLMTPHSGNNTRDKPVIKSLVLITNETGIPDGLYYKLDTALPRKQNHEENKNLSRGGISYGVTESGSRSGIREFSTRKYFYTFPRISFNEGIKMYKTTPNRPSYFGKSGGTTPSYRVKPEPRFIWSMVSPGKTRIQQNLPLYQAVQKGYPEERGYGKQKVTSPASNVKTVLEKAPLLPPVTYRVISPTFQKADPLNPYIYFKPPPHQQDKSDRLEVVACDPKKVMFPKGQSSSDFKLLKPNITAKATEGSKSDEGYTIILISGNPSSKNNKSQPNYEIFPILVNELPFVPKP
jgi:hypothetical protein